MHRTIPDTEQLPLALYRAEQVRLFDRIAIEECGLDGAALMQTAGEAVFAAMLGRWPALQHITVLCGTGNNAGDGFVIAQLARAADIEVTVLQLGDASRLQGDAKVYADQVRDLTEDFAGDLPRRTDLIIDALLGTGLERDVEGSWAVAIEAMNARAAPTVSVDIPSGLSSDRGAILGVAVRAQLTVTFIGLKQGLFTGQGPACSGDIVFNGLSVPAKVYARSILSARRLDYGKIIPLLSPRSRVSHKGMFGHVLVVGGDHGFAGAARLAAEAALRCGAGLVSVATRESHISALVSARPELMVHAVEDVALLDALLHRASVVVIGPGLGRETWGQQMLGCVLDSGKPLVVDADALNLIAGEPTRSDRWVITPHPGEAARLLQVSTTDIEQDRFQAARDLQSRYGGAVVLKGAGTVVASSNGRLAVCSDGNPGMATAGMGDVLSGVIGALLAQGLSLDEAADAGVTVHANAADRAVTLGQRGLIASDLFPHLRTLVNP